MFDFAVAERDEGSEPGRNDKGLVTYDRKTRKDAYFFYQANWNPRIPVVYIASRRMSRRLQAVTNVEAFSNRGPVELTVNGVSDGWRAPDEEHVCRWSSVLLSPGDNDVRIHTREAAGQLADHCIWTLQPATFAKTASQSSPAP